MIAAGASKTRLHCSLLVVIKPRRSNLIAELELCKVASSRRVFLTFHLQ